jgi:hypothetical protein
VVIVPAALSVDSALLTIHMGKMVFPALLSVLHMVAWIVAPTTTTMACGNILTHQREYLMSISGHWPRSNVRTSHHKKHAKPSTAKVILPSTPRVPSTNTLCKDGTNTSSVR